MSATFFTIEAGLMPCSSLNSTCFSRRRLGLVDRPLHRAGHPVGVHDRLAIEVARRSSRGLDQRAFGAQETLLVGVQDRDQRHFRHVQTLAQEVDAHQHIESAQAQIADDLRALDRADVGMQVADADRMLCQIIGQVLGHPLGQRGDQHALVDRDPFPDLREHVIDLGPGWPDLDCGIDQAGGPHDLLDDVVRMLALVIPRRRGDVDRLRREPVEFVVTQGPVVERRGQAEAVFHERLFA